MFGNLLASCSYDRKVSSFLSFSSSKNILYKRVKCEYCNIREITCIINNNFVIITLFIQVIIWKETSNGWEKLKEFCNHDSSGKAKISFKILTPQTC